MRRIVQTLFLLALCGALVALLGPAPYFILGTITAIGAVIAIAGMGGWYLRDALAVLGLGVLWPVLGIAVVASLLSKRPDGPASTTTGEPRL